MKRFCNLFTCVLAYGYRCLNRKVIVVAISFIFIIAMFLKWKIICFNMQSRTHLKSVCLMAAEGKAVGNLCRRLCNTKEILTLSCHTFHEGKETVMSAGIHDAKLVIKMPRSTSIEPLILRDNNENDFIELIKSKIKTNFNMSVTDKNIKKFQYLQKYPRISMRLVEMENLWFLLQNNEYLALILYEEFGIFPKLVGSCGPLYAVEKMNSIPGAWHLMTLYDSEENWKTRIKTSLLILDFLYRLDMDLPEPLHFCDVKLEHFGLTDDLKTVKYLDLDDVYPLSTVNSLRQGINCYTHSDCDFSDCRFFCNFITRKCQHGVANNNLQRVCEKIYLGWATSRKVMIPGFLMGPRTPRFLIEVLEQCANPDKESDIPRAKATEGMRIRLYNLLKQL